MYLNWLKISRCFAGRVFAAHGRPTLRRRSHCGRRQSRGGSTLWHAVRLGGGINPDLRYNSSEGFPTGGEKARLTPGALDVRQGTRNGSTSLEQYRFLHVDERSPFQSATTTAASDRCLRHRLKPLPKFRLTRSPPEIATWNDAATSGSPVPLSGGFSRGSGRFLCRCLRA